MIEKKFEQLEKWQQDLLLKAEGIMENAYNVYSNYHVGCAILAKDIKMFLGTFAENSSYGATICAERAALLNANTNGERILKAIAVIGRHKNFDSLDPVTPCGLCRQFISEFAHISDYDIELICSNTKKDKIYLTTINELLPYAFGPKDLNMDLSKFRR